MTEAYVCPFCKSNNTYSTEDGDLHWCACDSCQAEGPTISELDDQIDSVEANRRCIEAWNVAPRNSLPEGPMPLCNTGLIGECEECGEMPDQGEYMLYLRGRILCAHCVFCTCEGVKQPCVFCADSGAWNGKATVERINAAVTKVLAETKQI